MKINNLDAYLLSLEREKYEMVAGIETKNPLQHAFPSKNVVHAGLRGERLEPKLWQTQWNLLMSQKGTKRKRIAYLHIPFCRNQCLYCGFFQNFSHTEKENTYVDFLIKDLQLNHDSRYFSTSPIQAVYFGGGTPSVLSPDNLQKLLKAVKIYLPLSNDCEITLEARIHDIEPAKMEVCMTEGVNRVSIGVQSFHTDVRQKAGRLDDRETVLERLQLLSDYDQAAVIIDLMYGLPFQSMDVWLQDVKLLLEAALDGFDLYQLNVYKHSMLKRAIDEGKLPAAASIQQQADMFAAAESYLYEHQCKRLSICHWAKSNRERNLYNALSKSGAAILPFGAGAGGNIDGITVSLERNIDRYMAAIEKGEKPITLMLSSYEQFDCQKEVIAQFERGYLHLPGLVSRYDTQLADLQSLLDIWEKHGLVVKNGEFTTLTTAGRFWYVNMTQALLECLHFVLQNTAVPASAMKGFKLQQ